ncbi:Glyco_trans_2-like domain-containing protein [Vibrio chagasii]|nr:Glyco_trans_2-like domain-containing protein [Vibrio chagasii]
MFSVILPVYNGEDFIAQAVESVLNQTFKGFELILIDDGSSDGTLSILRDYESETVRVITRENKGLIFSLNEGVELSRYPYIVRMDADDICHENRLLKLKEAIEDFDYDFIASRANIIDMNNMFVTKSKKIIDLIHVTDSLPGINEIFHPSVCFSKELFYKSSGYLEEDKGFEDVFLWMRMFSVRPRFHFINDCLIDYRININSVRGVNESRYSFVLAMECIRQGNRKDALKYIIAIKSFDIFRVIISLLLPNCILRKYIKMANLRKFKRAK